MVLQKIRRFFNPIYTDKKANISIQNNEYVYLRKWGAGLFGYNVIIKNVKDKDDILVRKLPFKKKKINGFNPNTSFLK